MHTPCLAMISVTWIIWTVVFSVIPEGGLVLLGLVDTGDCCCWCTGEFRGSVAFMVFPPVVCIILLPLCDLVKGGGMTADVPGTYCLLFGAELDRGLSRSWMKSLGGPVRQGAEPTEGMWAFGIGRRNVNPCCGRFIPNPQLAGTWPLGADANCIINDVSFILQSLIGLLCNCDAWPPYDVTTGDWGSFTLQQLIAELWFSSGLYPEQFCSGLILGGYGTIGEWITLDPDIKFKQKSSQESL